MIEVSESDKYKCPYCGKTVAFKHECDSGVTVEVTKHKPPDRGDTPHILLSRRCDRHECRQTFWVEVRFAE